MAMPLAHHDPKPRRPDAPPQPLAEAWDHLFASLGDGRDFQARAAARDALGLTGAAGARWLVGRIRGESDNERLVDAASVLANIGAAALAPALEALRADPPRDQAYALLKAIGWMEAPPEASAERATLLGVVERLLDSPDRDLREMAAGAIVPLAGPRSALRALRARAQAETDPTVRDVVRSLIEDLEHA